MANTTDQEYIFDSGTDLGRDQLNYLRILLDPLTIACLDEIGVQPGQRCLDLGSGAGSIAYELAERTGSAGEVVAVDLVTDSLMEHPGVEVYQHDLNDGLPTNGPFDLIHARLLLVHLSRREEILTMLAEALAPGGWLVIAEYTLPYPQVLSAPDESDARLFSRVQDLAHTYVAEHGVSWDWAYEVGPLMREAGLVDVHCESRSHTVTGGTTGCRLNRNYTTQFRDVLVGNGVLTEAELDRYGEVMLDPGFQAWFYQLVITRGRRPLS